MRKEDTLCYSLLFTLDKLITVKS